MATHQIFLRTEAPRKNGSIPIYWQKVQDINQVISAADKLARDIIYKHTWGDKMNDPFLLKILNGNSGRVLTYQIPFMLLQDIPG